MGKNLLKIIALAVISIVIVSCTEQARVRNFGGSMEIKLPAGQKVLMATWKDSDLYYLIEPMDSNYTPKTKRFIENSSFGLIESEIIFIESK